MKCELDQSTSFLELGTYVHGADWFLMELASKWSLGAADSIAMRASPSESELAI